MVKLQHVKIQCRRRQVSERCGMNLWTEWHREEIQRDKISDEIQKPKTEWNTRWETWWDHFSVWELSGCISERWSEERQSGVGASWWFLCLVVLWRRQLLSENWALDEGRKGFQTSIEYSELAKFIFCQVNFVCKIYLMSNDGDMTQTSLCDQWKPKTKKIVGTLITMEPIYENRSQWDFFWIDQNAQREEKERRNIKTQLQNSS